VRALVTDLLEVVGLVLLTASAGAWAWTLAPWAGLGASGAGLLGCSALLTWRAR
jgi:hypothetical protein